ncbi:hypothetical protein [Halobacillus sp. KGW1]|uniref:hypothetical protein n=1 Tax=Halobacillus sp. KGW1 TaxID=1793726 RepID=UPI0007821C29|nr:hypothetical protein [Halobacillus sp. KGW1]
MKRKKQPALILFILFLLLTLIAAGAFFIMTRPSYQAERVVDEFYTLEQEGEYNKSWELLHTSIQEKFAKGTYIQDRSHVFMNHFGADTFTFTIDGKKKRDNWKMEKDGEPFGVVYEMVVTQTYHGKYGHFLFTQFVYVTKEEGEWRILWDYNK